MDKAINYIKYAAALVGGTITALLGGWDMSLKVLVLFVVLDYVTGVVAAFMEKKLDSDVGFKGICKKILLFVPIMIAYAMDKVLQTEMFRSLAICFYMANEGLSILENLGRAGVPIPKPLLNALEQMKKKGNGEETKVG